MLKFKVTVLDRNRKATSVSWFDPASLNRFMANLAEADLLNGGLGAGEALVISAIEVDSTGRVTDPGLELI